MATAMAAVSASIAMAPRIPRFKTLSTIIRHRLLSPSPIHSPFHHHHHRCCRRGMCDVAAQAVKKTGEALPKGVPDKITAETVKNIIGMEPEACKNRQVEGISWICDPGLAVSSFL